MAKMISCRDVGVDCDFEARGKTTEEVLALCAAHAQTAHGMAEIPPEMVEQVRAHMKDV